jgi:uncharacterized protein YggU (UPF0235/DUF167 family)
VFRDDGIHLYVLARPMEGRANSEAACFLADYFHVPKSRVRLFRGEHSKRKVFEIDADIGKIIGIIDPVFACSMATHIREV